MPVQKTQSKLLAKLGARLKEAHDKHKDDAPVLDTGGALPDGIENGIAKLVDLKLGTFQSGANKNETYLMGQGVLVLPKEVKGIPTEGLRTKLGPEPLCDTPNATGKRKTFDDHYAYFLNHLRILGFDPSGIDGTPEEIEEAIKAGMQELVNQGVYFRVRTWKGAKQVLGQQGGKWYLYNADKDGKPAGKPVLGPYPSEAIAKQVNPYAGDEPRVNEVWGGRVEYTPGEEDPGAGVDDQGEEGGVPPQVSAVTPAPRAKANGAPATRPVVAQPRKTPTPAPAAPPPEPEPPAPEFNEFGDVGSLAVIADDDDHKGQEQAQAELRQMALERGIDEEVIRTATNWGAIAEMLVPSGEESAAPGDEITQEEEAPEWAPAVGDMYKYQVLDPSTRKPATDSKGKAKRPVQVQVITVDVEKQKVKIKNYEDGKSLYGNVPWTALIRD